VATQSPRSNHAIALLLFLGLFVGGGSLAAPPSKTVLDGVYTSGQAKRGEAIYGAQCAICHRSDLSGFSGPPLKGDLFLDRWREFNLNVLFDLVKNTMPASNPGGLSEAAYLNVLAYLLEANEIPAGKSELKTGMLDSTLLVGKNGPQPLPTSAQVAVVGCLTLDVGNGWFLTHAAEPARTLDPWQTTSEELRKAAGKELGDHLFRLANITELPHFDRDALVDRKVQANGVLVRQPNNERINVTSLEKIGDACGR
jgi:mono/diheme cytochrome c family protein